MNEERAERAHGMALQAFRRIRDGVSHLETRLDTAPEHVELTLDIPEQPGLRFAVHLNLQNLDELHMEAPALRLSRFPCDDPTVADDFVETVLQLLAGTCRIVEYRMGRWFVGSELQAPRRDGWRVVSSYNRWPLLPSSWLTRTVLRNGSSA